MTKIVQAKARVVLVNKSKDKEHYQQARDERIGLMYTPEDIEAREVSNYLESKKQYYWVWPEKAMKLYDLIRQDTPPDEIVKKLLLLPRSVGSLVEIVETWADLRYLDRRREERAKELRDKQAIFEAGLSAKARTYGSQIAREIGGRAYDEQLERRRRATFGWKNGKWVEI